jgi:hypothetical protein
VRPVIFLHVGAMKTGTTFLQSLMHANQPQLLEAGVLVAGNHRQQVRGTNDIMNDASTGAWDRLVGSMFAHEGAASVISMEFLSFAKPAQAARVVESLHDAEVHVILTVRDAVRTMPAQWQTNTSAGGSLSWPSFARQVKRQMLRDAPVRSRGARVFSRTQGIPRMLDTWGATVPAQRLHVVTVPPGRSDPMLLWRRFAGVLGVEPAVCTVEAPRSNTSLGYPSTDLMRRLNERLGGPPRGAYAQTLGGQLAPQILGPRATVERSIPMNASTTQFALTWNRRVRDAIRASQAQLVGDLDELPAVLRTGDEPPATPLVDPTEDEVIAAARTARDGLIALVEARVGQLRAATGALDLTLPNLVDVPTTAQRWSASPAPLDAALQELCTLVSAAAALLERIDAATAAAETGRR